LLFDFPARRGDKYRTIMGDTLPLAIVTGASSGIGREVAVLLAQRGHRTVLVARRIDRLEELARQLAPLAPSVPLQLDLEREADIEPTIASVLEQQGPAQVLINDAGFGHFGRFLDTAPEMHRRLMQVNYFAAVAMIRAVLPGMLAQKHGHINIASMSTKMGPWGHTGYAAAKAAMVAMTQSLAAEHADDGVRFSYVNPGIVDTEYFAAPCFAPITALVRRHAIDPPRVARAIVGLLDHPRLELCVPRHYRMVDLIKAISPAWAFHIVRSQIKPSVSAGDGSPASEEKA
jgi:short-subunit dehydrogenase